MNAGLAAAAMVIAIVVVLIAFCMRWAHLSALRRSSYALASLRLHRLPGHSPTRLRLEAARSAFEQAWKLLGGKGDPRDCLAWFARGMELDELGCCWGQNFERKLEWIGALFTLPPMTDRDEYESLLAEGALVALLHSVLAAAGAQQQDTHEDDFRVVKKRLDVCVQLQPDNPTIYRLRADLLQRFGHLASKEQLASDYQQAIKRAEEDESGKRLHCAGIDPKQQRSFLIAHCAHRLGGVQHRMKQMDAAYTSYAKAVEHADSAFVDLADACFSLSILTLVRAKGVQQGAKPAVLVKAVEHFKAGVQAEREARKYLPYVLTEVSKTLAKELIKKFAKG